MDKSCQEIASELVRKQANPIEDQVSHVTWKSLAGLLPLGPDPLANGPIAWNLALNAIGLSVPNAGDEEGEQSADSLATRRSGRHCVRNTADSRLGSQRHRRVHFATALLGPETLNRHLAGIRFFVIVGLHFLFDILQ